MFRLPENVFFRKIPLDSGYSYEFEHKTLGNLGRIYVEAVDAKKCIVKSEIVNSHKDDPRGDLRFSIFQKISGSLTSLMESTLGSGSFPPEYVERNRPPDQEIIQSKMCLCRRCEKAIFTIIFYPKAARPSDFINVKRKMFGQLSKLGIGAYILGIENPDEGKHYIYKVWPEEKDLGFMSSAAFNNMVGEYCGSCLQ